MLDIGVIEEPAVALAALDPLRSRVLGALREPGSATTVAAELGLTRQQVNYHLRALEARGLVELVEERQRRGLTERVVQAAASGFVLSPSVLGTIAADPERADRLSARYVMALAARVIREVAELSRGADRAGKVLATLAIDTDIRFASSADRKAFTEELAGAVAALASKYHDEAASGGRWHRLVIAAHPRPTRKESGT